MAETLVIKPGQTNQLPAGEFNLPNTGALTAGTKLRGVRGKTVINAPSGASGWSIYAKGNDIELSDLIVAGGGLFVEGPTQNLRVDNNEFRLNVTRGDKRNAIELSTVVNGLLVTNNLFTGYNGSFGMYTHFGYRNTVVANNEFIDIGGGAHLDATNGSDNLLVEQNYFSGIKGMGLEFQSGPSNCIFQDNWYEKPNLSTNEPNNRNSFAYSLIMDRGWNIKIRRNICIAPERPDGIGVRVFIEAGGGSNEADATQIDDNFCNGVNHVLAVNDRNGPCYVILGNNRWMNFRQDVGGSNAGAIRRRPGTSTGPNAAISQLVLDRVSAGLRPGRNRRYGETIPAPPPDPTDWQAKYQAAADALAKATATIGAARPLIRALGQVIP